LLSPAAAAASAACRRLRGCFAARQEERCEAASGEVYAAAPLRLMPAAFLRHC